MKAYSAFLFLFVCFLLTAPSPLAAQRPYRPDLSAPDAREQRWVDSVYQSMSPDRRLGQLFMVRAHSDRGAEHVRAVRKLVTDYHVGGVCFFQGSPEKQLELTNEYQQLAQLPLLVSMDAEWGLGMRLPEQTISFPKQLALGAIRDNSLIYDMGAEIARQLHRLGVNVSFSPVLDINNNPDNPVIGTRSFGEDRYNVTAKGYAYFRGLQDHGILASAKHFPGHGDTDVDSHLDLPVIPHPRARLDSVELYPFRALIRYGIGSVMAAHLQIPALDERPHRPSSLSRPIVGDLLRGELGFTGLVFTDGLEMKGVTKHYGDGAVEAEAIAAGSDILLLPENTPRALEAIREYLKSDRIEPARLEATVRRILLTKYRLGLSRSTLPPARNLREELNAPAASALKQRLYEASLTLVRDRGALLPISDVDGRRVVSLRVGAEAGDPFTTQLTDYGRIVQLRAEYAPGATERNRLLAEIRAGDLVVAALNSSGSMFQERVPVTPELTQLLRAAAARTDLVIVVFGNPYDIAPLDEFGTVLVAYSRDEVAQRVAAQALFGATRVSGQLPVGVSPAAPLNAGLETRASFRMGYAPPERVGMDGGRLERAADVLAAEAIRRRATPGLVVLVARGGRIVLEKAYGHHTYRRARRTRVTDVFDLASVTKVAATTLSIMKLVDEGALSIDRPLGDYLPELRGTNKEFLTLRPILAHRAGLRSWIPFYTGTLNPAGKPDARYYRFRPDTTFSVPVTERMWMDRSYVDSLWQQLYDSPLPNEGQYRYSDLGFYLMARLVDRISGMPVSEFAAQYFYRPMGLQTLTYHPLGQFARERIPPTERDQYFRMQAVHGTVHDMGAAMLGGVSGHAGLFGSARDVATLLQMLLQNGNYGGRQYLRPETVALFTHRYPGETRRALGFDMKQLNPRRNMNMSPLASERAFGHLGFTGIAAWADPVEDLVYVFLSNRTYPSMNNNTLGKLDTRLRMHSAAYRAILPESRGEGRSLEP